MAVTNPNPLPWLIQKMVGGVSRHLLTAMAGSIGTACGLSSDQRVQFIGGGTAVIVWIAGALWSYMEKKDQMKPDTVPGKVIADTTVATVAVKTPASTDPSLDLDN